MYVVVSYTRVHGQVIRPGLSLVQAYQLLEHLGHGAIFRAEGMSAYSRPVYPWLRPARQPGTDDGVIEREQKVSFQPQGRVA